MPVMMVGMATEQPTLGARIRRARERARLSQEELAKAVGASPRAVGDWENNRRKPRNRIGALEEVLGVSLDDDSEPEPQIAPEDTEHLVDLIGRTVPNKRTAAILQDLVKAAARGEELPDVPVRRRRAAP